MRRIDLFYTNVIGLFGDISTELSDYYALNEATIEGNISKSELYADLNTEVDSVLEKLTNFKDEGVILNDLTIIEDFSTVFDKFILVFTDFPINASHTLKLWLKISNRFNDIIDEVFEASNRYNVLDEINITDFNNIDLGVKLIDNYFLNFDSNVLKSFIIYDFDETKLTDFLANEIHSAHYDVLLIFINFLNLKHVGNISQFVIINMPNVIPVQDLKSILKLSILLSGKRIKSLERYTTSPSKPHNNDFDFSQKYIQFENIINVLNEYNNQEFIIDKYLKLYHVIENFMYKYKICELQTKKGTKPFHINDFQSLYDNFRANENSAIQSFFFEVFKVTYSPGVTIKSLLQTEWNNLEVLDSAMTAKFDDFFASLNLSKYKYTNLKTTLDSGIFSILVYKLRNAIVHNKDSEFHIESTNLPDEAKFLFEKFFIPNLEKIIYHLIINNNNLVWYDNNSLLLYET